MARTLSVDLRSRLVAAVAGGHVSPCCGGALWRGGSERRPLGSREQHHGGDPRQAQGGDTRSHHIEAYRDVILAAIEARR